MPASSPPPDINDFLDAAKAGVVAKNELADLIDGSRLDVWNGTAAVLLTRAAQRARTGFRNRYFDTSDDGALDDIVRVKFPQFPARTRAAPGTGTLTLRRPTAVGSGGTIYEGTRVAFTGEGATAVRYYRATVDVLVATDALEVRVPVESTESGTTQSANTTSRLALEDVVFDNTLVPAELVCADGTDYEGNNPLRARIRTARQDARPGYETAIRAAMLAAGAQEIELYASDAFGDYQDYGLNRIYVADSSFNTSPELLARCRLATFDSVTYGMATQVLPMQPAALVVKISVTLWSPLSRVSRQSLIADVRRRAVEYIAANPYAWRFEALGGRARGTSSDIADVEIESDATEPAINGLVTGEYLTHWALSLNDCTVVIT
jgi:hypothetical protein